MSTAEQIMDTVLEQTRTSRVYTYPGSPPRKLLKKVDESDIDLVQTVREQHLLHLAQTQYYTQLEQGNDDIPVVIVSGEMGEAMLFQPLIAGSITAPCLIIVGEGSFPHVGNAINFDHQTDRGTTHNDIDNDHRLTEHENIDERMLFTGEDDINQLSSLIERIDEEKGIGIVHVPEYALETSDNTLDDLLNDRPSSIGSDELRERWQDAERPLLLVGRGARHPGTRQRIQDIARESGAPIATTIFMDGYFDDRHVGQLGPNGTPAANEAFFQADTVIAIGTSVKNTLTSFDPDNIDEFQQKTIQIEANPRRRSHLVGSYFDSGIDTALNVLDERSGEQWWHEDRTGLEQMRDLVPPMLTQLGQILRDEYPDTVVNFGVGNAYLWLNHALGPSIKKEVSRSGSMGETVAALERQDRPVLILGDGELEMDLSLILEATYLDTGATIFVVDNQRLGLVTEGQEREFGEIITPKDNPVRFGQLGEAFDGVRSHSVDHPDELGAVIDTVMDSDTVDIVHLPVEQRLQPQVFDPATLPRLDQSS